MVSVEDLVFEYPGKLALSDVSFQVARGSITALVGPNGSGKSTLLRCISGLDAPLSGRISVSDIDVSRDPRRVHQLLGYLSDAFGVMGDLTVRQCLIYAAGLHHLDGSDCETAITRVTNLLDLGPYEHVKAATLSRGWRQRLGIAQAIIHHPPLLLLDEPASGLDPEARVALSGLFKRLQSEGMTIVVSSHILAELEDYCTDMIVLRGGKLIEQRAQAVQLLERSLHVRVLGSTEHAATVMRASAAIATVEIMGEEIIAGFSGDEEEQCAILASLVSQGVAVCEFSVRHIRLQDVYLSLKAHS